MIPDLALADTAPASYVLAVAELREELICGPYLPPEIAAWHAAEVALWRGIVERHGPGLGKFGWCDTCGKLNGSVPYPCPDLLQVVAAAKAYLTGGAA